MHYVLNKIGWVDTGICVFVAGGSRKDSESGKARSMTRAAKFLVFVATVVHVKVHGWRIVSRG